MNEMIREVSNDELADLPEKWINSGIDTRKYIPCVMRAFEVDEETYKRWAAEGGMGEIAKGRYYIA